MGLFSKNSDTESLDDQALIKAARKRILAELEAKQSVGGGNTVNNNNYAGGGGGLMERMNGGGGGDEGDLRDYLVDITREDLPGLNELTGKPPGWKKTVHRYTKEKKK